jgi:hypothetical protein
MSEATATVGKITVPVASVMAGGVILYDTKHVTLDGWGEEDGKKFYAVTDADGNREVVQLEDENRMVDVFPDADGLFHVMEDALNEALRDTESPAGGNVEQPENGPVRPDLSRCEGQSASGRRCLLPRGHADSPDKKERKHRFVIREEVASPKTLKELRTEDKKTFGKFVLASEDIPQDADVNRQYNGQQIERDDDQKAVDAAADEAYKKWEAAGKPTGKFEAVAHSSGKRYIVPPAAFDTVIMMLRRSTQVGAPQHGKKLSYRRGQHVSGNVIINYLITDIGAIKTVKGENDENGTSE